MEPVRPKLFRLGPEIEHRKKSFLNLYLSPTAGSVQNNLIRALRDHDLSLCPSCGEAGTPNTLDHYLPKGEYPHFCVTPYNLFPMCDICQNKKSNKTRDQNNRRIFIHPYFDVFVADQVLTLTIDPPFDKPTFDFRTADGLCPEQERLVAGHVKELDIARRYVRFFREQHRRLLRLVQTMRETNQDVIVNLLNFCDVCSQPSKNAWEHIFYGAVLSNVDMLVYLQVDEFSPPICNKKDGLRLRPFKKACFGGLSNK